MNDLSANSLYTPPTQVRDFIDGKNRQSIKFVIGAVIATLLMGGLYIFGNGNLILPVAPLIFIFIAVLMWSFPRILVPFTVACACLFETNLGNFSDSSTDRIPIFWDVNTIFQIYGHKDFHGVAISIYEMFMIVAVLSGLLRGVYFRTLKLDSGVFIWTILAYITCVAIGLINGVATGGDMKIALFEVRAQFYILFIYLFTSNLKQDVQSTARTAMWITAICIGIKGVILTLRYFITLGGQTNPDLGVGEHAESFFFDEFVLLYGVLLLSQIEPKLRTTMLCFLPFVVMSNLANERRAATAAMLFDIPILLVLCFAAFPARRIAIVRIVAGAGLLLAIYLPLFWNGTGVVAQPARAIKSQWTPDDRDNSSDLYRIAEDANLMATMRSSPIIGYGYGKPIMLVAQMADVTNFDPLVLYLTHDQILWVWMRLGMIGFLAFWIMVASFIIKLAQLGVDQDQPNESRALGIFATLTVVALMFFALLDLQLCNVRDVLLTSTFIGLAASACRVRELEMARRNLPRRGFVAATDIYQRNLTGNTPSMPDRRKIVHGHISGSEPRPPHGLPERRISKSSDGINMVRR